MFGLKLLIKNVDGSLSRVGGVTNSPSVIEGARRQGLRVYQYSLELAFIESLQPVKQVKLKQYEDGCLPVYIETMGDCFRVALITRCTKSANKFISRNRGVSLIGIDGDQFLYLAYDKGAVL